jgi:hypothetical protein
MNMLPSPLLTLILHVVLFLSVREIVAIPTWETGLLGGRNQIGSLVPGSSQIEAIVATDEVHHTPWHLTLPAYGTFYQPNISLLLLY